MNQAPLFVGQQIRLVRIPDWLVHDLLQDERKQIEERLGTVFDITEIDSNGCVWMGFGSTVEEDEVGDVYRGQTFCVTPDCVEEIK